MRLRERTDRVADSLELVVGELREHWKRQHLGRDALGHRQVALAVAQELRRLLEVDRHGIVDLSADAALAEVRSERVTPAASDADRVGVKDVTPLVGGDLRRDHARTLEALVVHVRELPPPSVPLLELAQLDPQDRGLDLVEPRVVADDRVVVARGLAVLAERAKLLGEAILVRRDAPGLAVRAEVLRAIEGEAVDAPAGPGLRPVVEERAVRLRGVLDDRDVRVLRDLPQRLEVG